MSADKKLKIAIGIATYGRPEILCKTIEKFADQIRKPDAFIVGYAREQDVVGLDKVSFPLNMYKGERGLCAQRNVIIENTPEDIDIMVYFDDDFVASPDFIGEVEKAFLANENLVVATGEVLADGINTSGISFDEAVDIVNQDFSDRANVIIGEPTETDSAYGCNMIVDMRCIREHKLYFDEVLPEYGWQEDVDLTSRLIAAVPNGEAKLLQTLRGVHMGHKTGRSKGVKLGYSQIANIFYIYRKGVFPTNRLYILMFKNIIANTVKLLAPEPWVDRKGRLWGNIKGIFDVIRRKDDPRKISMM